MVLRNNLKLPLKELNLTQIGECEQLCFNPPYSQATLQSLCDNSAVFAISLLDSGQNIVSYILLRPVDLNHFEILRIASLPHCRAQGFASKFLLQIEAALFQESGKLDLEVASSNLPALNFYRKHGFISVGLRRNYYADGSDAVLMSKEIHKPQT